MKSAASLPVLLALLVMLIWGVTVLSVRVTVTELPPLFTAGLRFCFIAVCCLPFVRFPRRRLKEIIVLSVTFGSGHFGLLYIGLASTEAGLTGILLQLGVPFSMILAFILFKDRINLKQVIGMIIAFAGVVILFWHPDSARMSMGVVFIIISTFFWAVANIQIKQMDEIDSMQIIGAMALFAAPQLLFLSFLFEQNTLQTALAASWVAWAGFLFTVFLSSMLAHGIWCYLIKTRPISQIVPYSLLAPVVTVACAVWLVDEPLTLNRAVGGAIVLCGVALLIIRPRKRRSRAPLS